MDSKWLWSLIVALLAANLALVAQRGGYEERISDLGLELARTSTVLTQDEQEESLLADVGSLPAGFPGIGDEPNGDTPAERIRFLLVTSVDDCTNAIEDEIAVLNELVAAAPEKLDVRGWYVDEDRREDVESVLSHLSPTPEFPFEIDSVLEDLPEASTPLVLLVRPRDGRILDVHKPIPQDLTRRDAFYARWAAALDLVLPGGLG